MTQIYRNFVGIDIAAQSASVCWQLAEQASYQQRDIQQTLGAYRQLVKELTRQAAPAATLVVMEATSTYWLRLAHHLHAAGFVVSVINPAQARYFAKAQMQLAKTDQIDAALLVDFARRMQPDPWTPPPAVCEQLQQHLSRHEDLHKMLTQERNRLHALQQHPHADPTLIQQLQHHIGYLQHELRALRQTLQQRLTTGDHPWAAAARRLLTIQGVGLLTAAWLLVATQAFTRCQNPQQAAAFAGLAPLARDSGSSLHAHRTVGHRGHAALRRTLYMAALAAARFNPLLKTFYQRLLAQGKCKQAAHCAVARKLIHIAWALVTKQRDFDPHWRQSEPLALISA